jgi:carboxymethylenebutenolidase
VTGNDIELPMSGGGLMPAYLVVADGGGPRSGLVLLQEIFGVNANMRQTAEAFAALGYDVIAPDLFWRQAARVKLNPSSPADRERGMALMKGLDLERAVDDALAAAAHLRRSDRSSGRTGAVGYCLGGKLAYLLSAHKEIEAAVSYYGTGIGAALERADQVNAPLLLHIAMEDELCPPPAQTAIHRALGPRANVVIIDHPGVGHAFARRGSPLFNLEAAERADAATAAFLSRHIGVEK